MKKTIFGVILAAFLVMSVSWIAPINVKAAETDPSEIKSDIENLAELLSDNDDFLSLVQDSDLTTIIEKVYNPELREDEDTFESLVQDYKDTIENKEAYTNLCDPEVYGDEYNLIQEIYESLKGIISENNDFSSQCTGNLYKLGEEDELEITEEEDEEVDEESVFINEEGNVKLPGFNWVGINWSFIRELVKYALIGGAIGIIVGVVVMVLASLISTLLTALVTTLTTLLTNIGLIILGIGILLAVIVVVASVLYTLFSPEVINTTLNALEDESENESEDVKYKSFVSSVNARFREWLKQLLVFMKAQNLFA